MLFARALVFACAVRVLMRLPLRRVASVVGSGRATGGPDPERVRGVVEASLAFARPVVGRGCLVRGLTLYRFLRRAGLDVELAFGTAANGATLGHCWLVRDGTAYLEQRDPGVTYAEVCRVRGREIVGAT